MIARPSNLRLRQLLRLAFLFQFEKRKCNKKEAKKQWVKGAKQKCLNLQELVLFVGSCFSSSLVSTKLSDSRGGVISSDSIPPHTQLRVIFCHPILMVYQQSPIKKNISLYPTPVLIGQKIISTHYHLTPNKATITSNPIFEVTSNRN